MQHERPDRRHVLAAPFGPAIVLERQREQGFAVPVRLQDKRQGSVWRNGHARSCCKELIGVSSLSIQWQRAGVPWRRTTIWNPTFNQADREGQALVEFVSVAA
eukprot:1171583-Rhodomonas_salina.1